MAEKKPVLVEMGLRLKELREIKGKSQKEAAFDLGIKYSTLSSYEVGDREPSTTTLNKIAQYYSVTVDYLTGNSKIKSQIHLVLNSEVGLSDKAINVLKSIDKEFLPFISDFITNKGFYYFISELYMYKYLSEDDLINSIDKEYADVKDEMSKAICGLRKAHIRALGRYSFQKTDVLNALDVILKEFEEG